MSQGGDPAAGLSGRLNVVIGMTAFLLVVVLFLASRENAGIRAEAATAAFSALIIDLQARNRLLETQVRWMHIALIKGKFPDIDQQTIDNLQEILNAETRSNTH